MHYKTITLALLEASPALHETLRSSGTLLQTMERSARTLKAQHEYWKDALRQTRPESDPRQTASAALELAVQELREDLSAASPPNDNAAGTFSLDAAMALLPPHTPRA